MIVIDYEMESGKPTYYRGTYEVVSLGVIRKFRAERLPTTAQHGKYIPFTLM